MRHHVACARQSSRRPLDAQAVLRRRHPSPARWNLLELRDLCICRDEPEVVAELDERIGLVDLAHLAKPVRARDLELEAFDVPPDRSPDADGYRIDAPTRVETYGVGDVEEERVAIARILFAQHLLERMGADLLRRRVVDI